MLGDLFILSVSPAQSSGDKHETNRLAEHGDLELCLVVIEFVSDRDPQGLVMC
jgi:hypothetical protein